MINRRTLNFYTKFSLVFLGILGSALVGFSQISTGLSSPSINLETIPKIILFIFTLGGIFTGYIMLRMSVKLADLDAKVVKMVTDVEKNFAANLKGEVSNIELKIQLGMKDIESKMATFNDIKNIEKIQELQHRNIVEKMKGLEKQLDLAAYKIKEK